MGVVNVTPDSFSDGGLFLDADAAVAHGERLAERGRGDPRRRGRVDAAGRGAGRGGGELERVVPVVERLAGRGGARDLDRHDQAGGGRARRSSAGAAIVNDVSAFRFAPELAGAGRRARRRLLPDAHARRAAHDAGGPALRRRRVGGQGVPGGAAGLRGRARGCARRGSGSTRASASARRSSTTSSCCGASTRSCAIGRPVVVGTSRKSFLGQAHRTAREGDRVAGTIATNVMALERGASVFRVHDVRDGRGCAGGGRCYGRRAPRIERR